MLVWLLAALAPMNRTRVKQLLRSGRVTVNGASVTRHDHPLRPGDAVAVARDAPVVAPAGLAIVYEDAHLIAIDKPAGLLTVATETEKVATAFVLLSEYLVSRNAGRPFVVHRLDRDTSGLLLFARTADVRDELQVNWEQVTKTYLAVVEGAPPAAEGVIENYLTEGRDLRVRASRHPGPDAKRAVSRYKVRAAHDNYSLVEVTLETGRKHQIRVHMAGLGCPVAGDKLYGATTDPARRLCLHAGRLSFTHPASGAPVELAVTPPKEMARVVDSTRA
ncbi:MAG: RluA family pseudouridine synthase [Planctomycetes bacterium]|nr:RluA family pseudouridine synthase [Planctomycetota bacterium]